MIVAWLCALALHDTTAAFRVSGTVFLASNRPAFRTVVYLEGGPPTKPLSHFVVDQRDREFIPHVSVVTVGTRVDFPNDDNVFHNVFAEYQAKRFDLGMYPRGATKHQQFDKPGVVAMNCSVHSEMSAYIIVVDTPYYAISDRKGHFEIAGVRPGKYVVKSWHESGETSSSSLSVEGDTNIEVRGSRK